MTFHESGLHFTFSPQRWLVKKYDSHRFYKGLSGVGLKAVDFIALLDRETLVLMEVKNYRDRPEQELPRILEKIGGPKPEVVKSFTQKVQDSVRGIQIVQQFLKRKWFYRFLIPVLQRPFFHRWAEQDWVFWTLVAEAMHRKKVVLVLWLELNESYIGLSDSYMQTVRQYLAERASKHLSSIAPEVSVAEVMNHPFEDSLLVTFAPPPLQ